MTTLQALILGIIQGLTEFLPVSSSGHIEIGKALLGVNVTESLEYSIAVHAATVLSTLVVFRKDIVDLFKGVFRFKMNAETHFVLKIGVSMIPVLFVGIFFKDDVENLFNENILFVGSMLLITAILLALSKYLNRNQNSPIGYFDAFIIGIAQAVAVLPGISRSGATISTGLMLGKSKDEVAKFSFLMVIIPILGAAALDLLKGDTTGGAISSTAIITGFIAAFVSGYFACSWMVKLVRKSNLLWFAVYCAIVGLVAIIASL